MRDSFKTFLSQLSKTNKTLDYFTDFGKIKKNIKNIEVKLHQLNYLIGKDNLQEAIQEVYNNSPASFDILGILVAVRDGKKEFVLDEYSNAVALVSYFSAPDNILEYIEGTGLSDVFRDKSITNLVDYVFGIEVGLDTNARKNRSGKIMSKNIAKIFAEAQIFCKKEVENGAFPEIDNLGRDKKYFDFVIKTDKKTYLIEVNYYNGGGSKLNEVARSYGDLALKINSHANYEFVWITDGSGWHEAKSALEQAYNSIPSLYNLTTINNFLTKIQNENITRD